MHTTRRTFLATSLAGVVFPGPIALAGQAATARESTPPPNGEAAGSGNIGITTSSVDAHVSPTGDDPKKISLFDLPKLLRDELDMRVIDFNTRTLGSVDAAHVERLRRAVDDAGATVINLKLNQRDLDLGSRDAALRQRTIEEYKKCIDAAALLGARWVRPMPSVEPPPRRQLIDGYRELIDYGAPKEVGLLVENYRWLDSDPTAAALLIQDIGEGVAASPDVGNWSSNEVRYAGLESMFPLAVTCDFKARKLGPAGEHAEYDLERCFRIGWEAGFRGPWCFEHANADRRQLIRELALLRDMLRDWILES